MQKPPSAEISSFFILHSTQQPIDQRELGGGDGDDEHPDKKFAESQAALPGGGEPEL